MKPVLILCNFSFVCFSEKCKARGFTVIVDGRKSQWNVVKTVVLMLQVILFLTLRKWFYFIATDKVIIANAFHLFHCAQTSQQ